MVLKYKVINPYLKEIKDIDIMVPKYSGSPVSIIQPLSCNYGEFLDVSNADAEGFQASLTNGLLKKFIKEGHIELVEVDDDNNLVQKKTQAIVKEAVGETNELLAFIQTNKINVNKLINFILDNNILEELQENKDDLNKKLDYFKIRLQGAKLINNKQEIEEWTNNIRELELTLKEPEEAIKVEKIIVEFDYDKEYKDLKYQEKTNFIKKNENITILDTILLQEKSAALIKAVASRKAQLEKQ